MKRSEKLCLRICAGRSIHNDIHTRLCHPWLRRRRCGSSRHRSAMHRRFSCIMASTNLWELARTFLSSVESGGSSTQCTSSWLGCASARGSLQGGQATLDSHCEHLKPWYLEWVPTAQVPHLQLLWTWASQIASEVSALRRCSGTEVPD